MWLNGSLYVSGPPTDSLIHRTDGDGKADKEEVVVDGRRSPAAPNDLHGPYLGPDG